MERRHHEAAAVSCRSGIRLMDTFTRNSIIAGMVSLVMLALHIILS